VSGIPVEWVSESEEKSHEHTRLEKKHASNRVHNARHETCRYEWQPLQIQRQVESVQSHIDPTFVYTGPRGWGK
jgi:hypothetical protein